MEWFVEDNVEFESIPDEFSVPKESDRICKRMEVFNRSVYRARCNAAI